jgi:hypothetical protein
MRIHEAFQFIDAGSLCRTPVPLRRRLVAQRIIMETRACRWQFQIFAGTWTKFPPLDPLGEDSFGIACCILSFAIPEHNTRELTRRRRRTFLFAVT